MQTLNNLKKDDVVKSRLSFTLIINLVLGLAVLFLLPMAGCDDDIVCQRADSSTTTENRSVTGFDGVIFSTIGDLYISQGAAFSFKIQGPQNVVEATTSNVDDGLLVIASPTCFNGNADIRVDITAPDLNRIGLSGTGKVFISDTLRAEYLSMELYGQGEILSTLKVDSLYTEVVGSGTIGYKGKVHDHMVACSGDLVMNAFDLVSDTTSFKITGMGNAQVRVNKKLNVTIAGKGDIYYKGNPVIQSNITGSGNVINSN